MAPFDPDRDEYFYRTKDFQSIPAASGDTTRAIVGRNARSRHWLMRHKGDNLRKQFLDQSGALIATDHTELERLINCVQREFLV